MVTVVVDNVLHQPGVRVLLLLIDQTVDIPGAQVGIRVHLIHNPVSHALLVHLPIIDLLLQGIVSDKSVHMGLLLLAIPSGEIQI